MFSNTIHSNSFNRQFEQLEQRIALLLNNAGEEKKAARINGSQINLLHASFSLIELNKLCNEATGALTPDQSQRLEKLQSHFLEMRQGVVTSPAVPNDIYERVRQEMMTLTATAPPDPDGTVGANVQREYFFDCLTQKELDTLEPLIPQNARMTTEGDAIDLEYGKIISLFKTLRGNKYFNNNAVTLMAFSEKNKLCAVGLPDGSVGLLDYDQQEIYKILPPKKALASLQSVEFLEWYGGALKVNWAYGASFFYDREGVQLADPYKAHLKQEGIKKPASELVAISAQEKIFCYPDKSYIHRNYDTNAFSMEPARVAYVDSRTDEVFEFRFPAKETDYASKLDALDIAHLSLSPQADKVVIFYSAAKLNHPSSKVTRIECREAKYGAVLASADTYATSEALSVNSIAFSPNGKHLAILTQDPGYSANTPVSSHLHVFDLIKGSKTELIDYDKAFGKLGNPSVVTWGADGEHVFAGHEKGFLSVWKNGKLVNAKQPVRSEVTALALAPDNKTFFCGFKNGSLKKINHQLLIDQS